MIFRKPKPFELEGPYQDTGFGELNIYGVTAYFTDEKEAKSWLEREEKKIYPRRRFFEWLFDKLQGE